MSNGISARHILFCLFLGIVTHGCAVMPPAEQARAKAKEWQAYADSLEKKSGLNQQTHQTDAVTPKQANPRNYNSPNQGYGLQSQTGDSLDIDYSKMNLSEVDYGQFHALVIGVNSYAHLPALRSAINDARAIGNILSTKYGYKVTLLLDAKRADILDALGKYRATLTKRENLLLYYAGHGWLDEDSDEGYWLPADSKRDSNTNWVSNSSITSALRAMRAKHVMVVADSCYAGKLTRGIHIKQRTPDYFQRISEKRARVVLSSGGLEPVLDSGGKSSHSAFASAFLDALTENRGIIDGTALFTRIRRQVMLNADQTPEYSDIRKAGHDGGDFIFVRSEKR